MLVALTLEWTSGLPWDLVPCGHGAPSSELLVEGGSETVFLASSLPGHGMLLVQRPPLRGTEMTPGVGG